MNKSIVSRTLKKINGIGDLGIWIKKMHTVLIQQKVPIV